MMREVLKCQQRVKKIVLTAQDVTPASGAEKPLKWKQYLKLKRRKDGPKKIGTKKAIGGEKKKKKLNKKGKKSGLTAAQIERHDTGASNIDPTSMRGGKLQVKRFEKLKEKFEKRVELTAKAERRLREVGYIAPTDEEPSYNLRQSQIADEVDLASKAKFFELKLPQFGPYHIDYTENGRHLLLGGRRGHVAALDWQTKSLHCETNVMETVKDVKYLHTENFMAVAQKHYTYVYDNVGTELHCLKSLYDIVKLEFLPHHFLLVGTARNSFIYWLDVSVGKMVMNFPTKCGPLNVMCKNPANAIIHTGQTDGTVALWSPNAKEPLVKMLAHKSAIKGIAVDEQGKYMITTGLDKKCRVWDVRMYRQLHAYAMPFGVADVAISQKNTIACSVGNYVQVFKDTTTGHCKEPFLVHNCGGAVTDLKFVPWEDVLGVGHENGFTSMLVPGSGEANVDMLRSNPYETKSQRREREVKQLLDKLQPELICLDPNDINRVNEDLLEQEMEERKKILYVRPVEVQYTPKHKMRGRGVGTHKESRKQVVKEKIRVEHNKEKEQLERELSLRGKKETEDDRPKHVLDRFRKKN
ncbi:unnamed protein product [Caenorhabditis auriculariae]|uniref:BING4 C-terminal domain-containing protein n=1 Tax=Caenorhabditis auriculariae TaxID=2777116 RepID=A0A8S1HUP4_9PELO|nr:unnamed protein product [Caenorhabditis auriculariae]